MDPGSPAFPLYYFQGSHGAASPASSVRSSSSELSAGEGSAAAYEQEKSAAALPSWVQQGACAAKEPVWNNVDRELGSVLGPLVDANGVLSEHGDPVVCWWDTRCEVVALRALLEREPRSQMMADDECGWEYSPGIVWNDELVEPDDEPLPHVVEVVRTEKKTEYLVGALFHNDEEEMFQPAQRCFLGFVEAGLAPPTWASRKGLRTLACGDFVENERGAVAVVVRVLTFEWPLDSPSKQWRNVLVLYDEQAEDFFIGGWSKWTRTAWPYGTDGDEVEMLALYGIETMAYFGRDDENVLGVEKIKKIEQLFASSTIRKLPASTAVSRSKGDALTPTEEKEEAEERRREKREKGRRGREAEARR